MQGPCAVTPVTSADRGADPQNLAEPDPDVPRHYMVGDAVLHPGRGLGRVSAILEEGARQELVLEFLNGASVRLEIGAAGTVLKRLPPNGLRALVINDADRVRDWVRGAPLKLVAAAMTDIGRSSRPADIRATIAEAGINVGKWESWWKQVQPALRTSTHFWRRADGAYSLRGAADELLEVPLVSQKRPKPLRPTESQLEGIVLEVESGGRGLTSVEGADNQRLVVRRLLKEFPASHGTMEAISSAMRGPVVLARVVLEEIGGSTSAAVTLTAAIELVRHVQHQLVALTSADAHGRGEQVASRLAVLDPATIARHAAQDRVAGVQLVNALTDIAALLERRGGTGAAAAAAKRQVSQLLAQICMTTPAYVATLVDGMSLEGQRRRDVLAVLNGLMQEASDPSRSDMTRRLLGAALRDADLAIATLQNLVPSEQRLPMASLLMADVLTSRNPTHARSLVQILTRITPIPNEPTRDARVGLAITLASMMPSTAPELAALIRGDLVSMLAEEGQLPPSVGSPERDRSTLLGALQAATDEIHARQRGRFYQTEDTLRQRIGDLEEALESERGERTRLEQIRDTLKGGLRTPDQWATFAGKREVAEGLAALYQELMLARGGVDQTARSWLLGRMEATLQRHGILKFGSVGTWVPFDPSAHEYLPGASTSGQTVRIVCPGFRWRDPKGDTVILMRAKVEGK